MMDDEKTMVNIGVSTENDKDVHDQNQAKQKRENKMKLKEEVIK